MLLVIFFFFLFWG